MILKLFSKHLHPVMSCLEYQSPILLRYIELVVKLLVQEVVQEIYLNK